MAHPFSRILLGEFPCLPPWARVAWRRIRILLNLAVIAYLVAQSEMDGVGMDVALQFAVIGGQLSNISLLWKLLWQPRTTAPYLSMQTVCLLSCCWWARACGVSRWSVNLLGLPHPHAEDVSVAVVSTCIVALAAKEHLSGSCAEAGANGPLKRPAPFGAELLRPFQGSSTRLSGHVKTFAEHLLLPLFALLLSVPIALALTPQTVRERDIAEGRAWPLLATWHESLEAVAMLPQLQSLHATRTSAAPTGEASSTGGLTVRIPLELQTWLTALAVGHLFALLSALVDAWSQAGAGSLALFFGFGEACNAAVLAELLVAHFSAKWSGKASEGLVLPV